MLTATSHHRILHMSRDVFPEDILHYFIREHTEADEPVIPETVLSFSTHFTVEMKNKYVWF